MSALPVTLVIDECDTTEALKDKFVRFIFYNGRFWSITLVVSTDDLAAMPPSLQSNVDYVFSLSDHPASREHVWKAAATSNYGALVLDNITMMSNVDCTFFYRACV